MSTKPTNRNQIPAEFTWNLADLFASDDIWENKLSEVKNDLNKIIAFAGHLSDNAKTLLDFLKLQDELSLSMDQLGNYAYRKADEDTRNSVYQQMKNKFTSLAVEINQACAFEVPELLSIDEDTIEKFYKDMPELEHYRLALDRIRRQKEHILSKECEEILAATGMLRQAPDEIFSMLNDADMTFNDAIDSNGNKHPVTHGSFVPLLQSSDRTLRQSAFKSLYGEYKKFRNTSAAILNSQMKQLKFISDMRKYKSPLEASLDDTEVPTAIYHNLIKTVHANMSSLHDYVSLRKKLLGVDELHFYDMYTPIVADEDFKIPYEEAKKITLDALKPLGEDYISMLNEGFYNRWIDVYENAGKRSGAYSAGAYGVHPYVLLNYTDTLDDVFTLVHEMGHALHSYLSNKNQSVTYANYVIFVAEVASTCNESLLMQYLLKQTSDKKKRAYLINHFLEQFRGTLYRQTMFAEFELWCSEQVQNGHALTADSLDEKYAQLNRQYYGNDVHLDSEIALEWARIPHFYYDFYVYQYATGFSAAIALSQRILNEGKSAVEDYLKFLSGGCSTDPVSLLKQAGIDMDSPKPIENALQLFTSLIDELRELCK